MRIRRTVTDAEAGADGADDPAAAVDVDGVPPRRRDSSSVVLRMVRSLGESSSRS